MTVQSKQDGLPDEKILHGPFTVNRHELLITEYGLYGRSARATKIASLIFSVMLGLTGITLATVCAAASQWFLVLFSLGLILLAGSGIQEYRRIEFQPFLRIVDGKIVINGKDCGLSDGAYVLPNARWVYEIRLFNDQNPKGISVIALPDGRHLKELCALLTAHLYLDGSRTTDWPPRPDKG